MTLRTYGGFAPGLLPPARVIETSRLDEARAHRLAAMVALVHDSQRESRAPDERRYELAIEERGQCRTVRCADSTMSAALADVIAFIEAHGDRA